MLSCLWVPPREYRKAMFVVFLDEPFNYFSFPNNDCFTSNDGMLLMKKVQIFSLGNVKQTTNILPGFCIVSIYYGCFIGFFDKQMGFWSLPECTPNALEWNLFNEFLSVVSEVLNKFPSQITTSLVLKPC
jgi:hypothetical protein